MTNEKPIAISFFTGAGGLDMGFAQAGFDIKLCVEIEEKYCLTLIENHPTWNVKCADIQDYDKKLIYKEAGLGKEQEVDVIIGGSPCQSFSTAGKRQAFEDPRGRAMLKYAEIIQEVKPKVFVLENVRGLLSAALKHRKMKERGEGFPPLTEEEKSGSALKHLLGKFEDYNITKKLVNSAMYGVPQKRERVFIIGIRKDLNKTFNFPEPTHNKNGDNNKQKWVSVENVFKDLNDNIKKHDYVEYSPERLKYMKMIPEGGGNWRDLPENLVKEAMGGAYNSGGGKVGFYRRIKIDEPAPTLLTSPMQKSTNLGHPFEDRPLSIQEYMAIQGFPLDYELQGSLNDKYAQVGNAVPVKLSYVIGSSIYDLLK
jgi:DNA (cytosine-5)-methyltransferase 1